MKPVRWHLTADALRRLADQLQHGQRFSLLYSERKNTQERDSDKETENHQRNITLHLMIFFSMSVAHSADS